MTEIRLYLYAFIALGLLLGMLVIQQGQVIQQQRDLIREMKTNPACISPATAPRYGGTLG